MSTSRVRTVVGYVLDWAVVIVIAVAGGILNYISGFHRPFSLIDPDIVYPNKPDIVSIPVVVVVALVVPAITIVALSLDFAAIFSGGPITRRERWISGGWQAHAGVLGLCMGLAATLFITSGLKDLVGKPRPDLLARCQPNLNDITAYLVGGLGNSLDSEAGALVSSGICQQTDKGVLDDGFAAFPSGHSSFSSAGMVYFSLWLCTRFALRIPYLRHQLPSARGGHNLTAYAQTGAAPPLWQVAIAATPIVVALFICASRYADFHHGGFDIIAGAVIGTVIAWASFRLYHLPIRRNGGQVAWNARSQNSIFFATADNPMDLPADEEQARNPSQEPGSTAMKPLPRVGTGGSADLILPAPANSQR